MRSSLGLAAVSLCAAILARASLHHAHAESHAHARDSARICVAASKPDRSHPELLGADRPSAVRDRDCYEWTRVPNLSVRFGAAFAPNGSGAVEALLGSVVSDR